MARRGVSLPSRLRRRRELTLAVRFDNPRNLTRDQYVAETERQRLALAEFDRASMMPPPPPPWEVWAARGKALRDAHYGPAMTRDEMAAAMNADLVAEAARR